MYNFFLDTFALAEAMNVSAQYAIHTETAVISICNITTCVLGSNACLVAINYEFYFVSLKKRIRGVFNKVT